MSFRTSWSHGDKYGIRTSIAKGIAVCGGKEERLHALDQCVVNRSIRWAEYVEASESDIRPAHIVADLRCTDGAEGRSYTIGREHRCAPISCSRVRSRGSLSVGDPILWRFRRELLGCEEVDEFVSFCDLVGSVCR